VLRRIDKINNREKAGKQQHQSNRYCKQCELKIERTPAFEHPQILRVSQTSRKFRRSVVIS
jgi:hypothetical protein